MTRRVRTWCAPALLLVAVLAGCGVRPSGVITGGDAPSGPPKADDTTLYFVSPGGLVPVQRAGGSADVVTLLAAGPDAGERARGLTSEVPASALLADVRYGTEGLEVSLDGTVSTLTPAAIDQIACTVLANEADSPGLVTLRGFGHTWPKLTCDD